MVNKDDILAFQPRRIDGVLDAEPMSLVERESSRMTRVTVPERLVESPDGGQDGRAPLATAR